MWKDGKYLLAYLSPLAAGTGFYLGGWYAPGALYLAFLAIPLLELAIPANTSNVDPSEEASRSVRAYFDWLLYLHVPIVYGLLALFIWRVAGGLTVFEFIAMSVSMGIILGTGAINVAHELGHRPGHVDQYAARLLLIPALYSHFTIEHNYGHHKHVGTPQDPATAPVGLSLYQFWIRSVVGSWHNAWRLEQRRQANDEHLPWFLTLQAGMVMQLLYLAIVFLLAGAGGVCAVVLAAVVGFLLLESVNYIEHYGLCRARLEGGRFAPVQVMHSWNSDHELGRIFLYELTRHPDHHYRTTRKYQILRHLDEAPQLPYGYPASIILALLPPLWRRVMDKRIPGLPAGTAIQREAVS